MSYEEELSYQAELTKALNPSPCELLEKALAAITDDLPDQEIERRARRLRPLIEQVKATKRTHSEEDLLRDVLTAMSTPAKDVSRQVEPPSNTRARTMIETMYPELRELLRGTISLTLLRMACNYLREMERTGKPLLIEEAVRELSTNRVYWSKHDLQR